MIRCGELCKGCKYKCNGIEDGERVEVQCTACEGQGCEACVQGYMQITTCPKEFVGELSEWIWLTGENYLPEPGGLLDQPAWFLDLKQNLQAEENAIDEERLKRANV